uniref:Retrovirus-related Pol polyprotein from transposon TNT 1-94-like beta-barrel domain-containing protein n=1 Tax=Fagus sylvatica TaxID=28930 RepID=A0A2N9EHH2_FAGSY
MLEIITYNPTLERVGATIALSVSCSLRLFWHSSAASTISGIAPPPPSEFRCARCRQRLNNRQRLTAFVGTSSPGFQSKHLHHHWKDLSKTISAAQKSPPSDAGRAATRRSKFLPAVTPRHAPHAPGSFLFIKGRKLWFYVTGEMKKPVQGSSEDENAFRIRLIEWDSNNHQILTWLRNTSIPSISNLLGNFDDARTAWDMLAKRYSSSHGTREYQLSIEQYQIRQDPGQSINDFFARFQFIWDQLDLSDPPWDTPNDAMKYATRRDQMRLYQFLMALHDDYEPVRGQLLHQLPTPSLDAALNDLVREETRLQTLQAQNKLNVLATTSPLAPLPQSDSDQFSPNTRRSDRKSNKFCRYCKKHGHTIETCFRRNRSTAAVTHGDTDQTPPAAVAPAHSGSAITLTTDQLEDIIAQALVRAGNASSSSALSVLPGKFSSWLLDSACCNHMTPYPSFFSHTSSARHAPTIHTANGSTMLVRSIGTVSTSQLSISDVFHVPKLSYIYLGDSSPDLTSSEQAQCLGYYITSCTPSQSDSDQFSPNTRRSDRKSNKFCRYCKKHGHTIETCFRRNRSTAAVTHGDTDQTPPAAVAPAHSGSAITLTTDQLEDIIAQALVRAGNASSSSALSVLPGKFSSWLLDSACCNHMTPYPSFFSHTSSARHAPTIHTANGSTMLVRSIGTVSTSQLSISDVFHVPKLSYNLLSVGQLAELGYRIILDYFGCIVQDPRTGQELGTGRRIGRLFEISSLRLPATGVSAATSSSPPPHRDYS